MKLNTSEAGGNCDAECLFLARVIRGTNKAAAVLLDTIPGNWFDHEPSSIDMALSESFNPTGSESELCLSPIFDNSAIDGISAAAEDVFAVFRIPAPPAPMIQPCHVLN
jgi:hypothetical protein